MTAKEFKKVVIPMGKKLYNFARLLLRDEDEADDAVQEVFIKLWKLRKKLSEYRNLEAFAMTINKNWCLDRLKAKRPIYIENYEKGYDCQHTGSTPDKILETQDKLERFYKIMDVLPGQQKLIVQLRDVEGYEYEEIAEIMNMNINAIRVNLSRARNKVKELLVKTDKYGYQENRNIIG